MKKSTTKRALKWVGIILLIPPALVLLVLIALYIPPIQNFVVNTVLDKVNSSGDMHISIDDFSLSFPLGINVRGLEIMQKGDTLLTASSADVDVSLFPLIKGDIEATGVRLRDVYFKSGTPDSVTYIRANVGAVDLDRAVVKLSDADVDLGNLDVNRGRIRIALKNDTTPPTPPTPQKWKIHARSLSLHDIDYAMTMESSITSLGATLESFVARKANMDMASKNLSIADVEIDKVNVRCLTSDVPVAAVETPKPDFPQDTIPWTIGVDKFRLAEGGALYALEGVQPQPGLDMNYIEVSHLAIDIDDFMSEGADIRVPVSQLTAHERSGLSVALNGVFEMTPEAMFARDFMVRTLASEITLDAVYGISSVNPGENPVKANIGASISPADIELAMPSMKGMVESLPRYSKIDVGVDVDGMLDDLSVNGVKVSMKNYWEILLKGKIAGVSDFDKAVGHLDIDGNVMDGLAVKKTLVAAGSGNQIDLPPFSIDGDLYINHGKYDGVVKVFSGKGEIALDAVWNGRTTDYDLSVDADGFPVDSFMPGLGLGKVTAAVDVKGHGLDIFSDKTHIVAGIDASDVMYNGHSIHDMTLTADLSGGTAKVGLRSTNPLIDMSLDADGNLSGRTYKWKLAADINRLDLHALGLTDSASMFRGNLDGGVVLTPGDKEIDAALTLHSIDFNMGSMKLDGRDIGMKFNTNDSTTNVSVDNGDFALDFASQMGLDSVAARFSRASEILFPQIEQRRADVIQLQQALPPFRLDVRSGNNNAIERFVASNGVSFKSMTLNLSNDSLINIKATVDSLVSGETRLDRIDLTAGQHGGYLRYNLRIDNEPGTFDAFAHIQANGYLDDDKLSLFFRQQNIEDEVGYNFGALISMSDSTFSLKFVPFQPVIGYKQWEVNKDNFLTLNTRHLHLDANVNIENDESRIQLYTDHDSTSHDNHQERIFLKIDKIQIADWIAVSPYAPPMRGDLSANLGLSMDEGDINGRGTVSLADFMYNKKRVGTLDLDLDVTTNLEGTIWADAGLKIDSRKVMTASGHLNDTTAESPFLLDFNLDRFPLAIANPFLEGTGTLAGYLNGDMDIRGSLIRPKFDGYINFDSATVRADMLPTTFRISDTKIPVDSNVVKFKHFEIYGLNDNPLVLDGTIDLTSLSAIKIDIDADADNMQVVGNDKKRGSDIYGKAFVSIDANAKGSTRFIRANANVTVNAGTNVTYVIPDATSQLTARRSADIVKFVNFNDTAQVISADTVVAPSMALMLNAILNIQDGSTIAVDLSGDGKNRAQIQAQGTVEYTMSPMGDDRFTGRINLNSGYVRYTPPLMSQKLFDFQPGSYVAFNGPMMNPILNVTAIDRMKANVTQEGQNSRLIYFDVILKVTGTLEQMGVTFDLTTDDDVTVDNELQSMTPEQRANQAMNLLLYNVYTGPNTKGDASLTANPLYSFLESTVNSWMANNIKGVDISFGIDNYERTVEGASSMATSYSYKVSKSFLNDRIKIVVGGNYSTDADAEENVSQNLINDISFEYYLNKTGTMYVRLFRHTGYESILEGEVTQTGVGFVFKRKLRTLRDIFRKNTR